MQHTWTDTTVDLTATLGELNHWQHLGLAVYGTPTMDDTHIAQVYVDRLPKFRDDACLAQVQDFLDVEGWDELELEEDSPLADDTITLSIPRDWQGARARLQD